jgi:hypothetical protein
MNLKERKLVLISTILTTIVSLFVFFVALNGHWFGEFSGAGDVFCEKTHDGLVKQPANTWSNLMFIFGGLLSALVIYKGKFESSDSPIFNQFFYGIFFCNFFVLLGPGSMAMHASMTNIGGFFDMLSMYLICSFTFAYSILRYFKLSKGGFLLLFIVNMSICLTAHFLKLEVPLVHFSGNLAFAIFLILMAITEIFIVYKKKIKHDQFFAWAALICILLSFTIWNLTQTGSSLCDPSAIIQGHAIWHILDAVALGLLFRYYISQKRKL